MFLLIAHPPIAMKADIGQDWWRVPSNKQGQELEVLPPLTQGPRGVQYGRWKILRRGCVTIADPPLKIVFMGTPGFAAPVLSALMDAGHDIVGVYTQPDRPSGRRRRPRPSGVKALAIERGLRVFQPESLRRDEGARRDLASLGPDLIVVAAYGLYIPVRRSGRAAARLSQRSSVPAAALSRAFSGRHRHPQRGRRHRRHGDGRNREDGRRADSGPKGDSHWA